MDELRVLRQYTSRVTRGKWGPGCSAGLELGGVYQEIERLCGDINPYQVTVAHQCYRTTVRCLRRYMSNT